MEDRTSAGLFADIFEYLAADKKPLDRRAFARWLWKKHGHFDFTHEQLECEEALSKLGLARRIADPDSDDGGTWVYGPEGESKHL